MEEKEIRELLMQIELLRKKWLQPYFKELGLKLGQGQPRILKMLYENEPITQRKLSDACGIDVTTMSRTLDKLGEAGYIERRRNPECRRSFLVVLTKEGREKAVAVVEAFALADREIGKGFDAKEQQFLGNSLKKIVDNFDTALKIRGK